MPAASAPVRLRLAVTPTFSRQILLPRLALFRHANPEVELVMQVAIPLADLKSEDADLEIRFGSGEYPGLESRRVLTDDLSVGALIEERLGPELLDRIIEPLLGGVYAVTGAALWPAIALGLVLSVVAVLLTYRLARRFARKQLPTN
mgnify:CR=1 FL=1